MENKTKIYPQQLYNLRVHLVSDKPSSINPCFLSCFFLFPVTRFSHQVRGDSVESNTNPIQSKQGKKKRSSIIIVFQCLFAKRLLLVSHPTIVIFCSHQMFTSRRLLIPFNFSSSIEIRRRSFQTIYARYLQLNTYECPLFSQKL